MSIKKKNKDMTKEEITTIIEIIMIWIFNKENLDNNFVKTIVILMILNSLKNVVSLDLMITSKMFLIIDLKLNLINFFQRLILSLARNNSI